MHDTSDQFVALFYVVPLGIAASTALILRLFPALWSRLVRETDAGRNLTMDGARGLLTLWVLTYHLDLVAWVVHTPKYWRLPPGRLATMMESGFFVAPFFELTGLLFGGALIASRGRLDTIKFLRRRAFRIVPAYAVSIMVIFTAALCFSGFHINVGPLKFLFELVRWSLFGFVARYDINGVDLARSHGMLWTLPFEISFYLLIPLLAWAQRKTSSPVTLFVALLLLGAVWWPFIFFAGGIVSAALVGWRHRHATAALQAGSILCVVLLIATVHHTSSGLQAVLLAPIFAAVAREAPMFRLLRVRALRFIGETSYSVYILHYPVLWIIFLTLGGPGALATMNVAGRWIGLIGWGMVVLATATLCYVFVERPLIAFGRSLERRGGGSKMAATVPDYRGAT